MSPPKPFSRTSTPLARRALLRRRLSILVILVSLPALFVVFTRHAPYSSSFASPPPSPTIKALLDHIPPTQTSFAALVSLSDSQRADALAHALAAWRSGPLPPAVSVAAAVCTPRDAADALLRGDLSAAGVLDVGANAGYPVTRIALQRAARWVVSVEPDKRNFARLARLPVSRGRAFLPVKAAASHAVGRLRMKFHKTRDDFTCFDCLDESKDYVFAEDVDVCTVDTLLLDGDVANRATLSGDKNVAATVDGALRLFKTDTQGHEAEVLTGARRVFAGGRVENVLVEFDPKLFRVKDNAMRAMTELFNAGFQCTQLTFAALTDAEKKGPVYPFFGRVPITNATADRFYEFVRQKDKYTDLLCSKR